jgi:anaerobic selenocysteine-containing dehydrogenase
MLTALHFLAFRRRVFGQLSHPEPIREEFTKPQITGKELESLDIGLGLHRKPQGISDIIAYYTVRMLRKPTDWFFKTHYVHRAVMLETVAAVPGLVAGMLRHLKSLRNLSHDGGWYVLENSSTFWFLSFVGISNTNHWPFFLTLFFSPLQLHSQTCRIHHLLAEAENEASICFMISRTDGRQG